MNLKLPANDSKWRGLLLDPVLDVVPDKLQRIKWPGMSLDTKLQFMSLWSTYANNKVEIQPGFTMRSSECRSDALITKPVSHWSSGIGAEDENIYRHSLILKLDF